MYRETFPSRIKKAREEAGYTQQQISDITGICRSSIAKYEVGSLEPSLETLGTLAQFLNVNINWLLGVTLEPEIKSVKSPKIWE